ncbi:uncharacterized protein EDB91DRAFT_1109926 [Suillus paluster]|uniref:uncharacterized protein n=1 Tax=Suillus paluster TaxID=48578 RepID=UPI001B8686C3|nr:uncharacterized protein EDB91DRAFT_1109926 [Suillus paluster]KAG1749838.1 hypothetical protein EDB91DRAFT_1109926 [Suillus paluster]
MITTHGTRLPTKFYQEDIVRRIDSPNVYGIVLRCWHDAEDIPPLPSPFMDPLMRSLDRGEIGVSFFPGGVRDIVPESDYELVDRTFQSGDYCKRSVDDVRSGVVTSIEAQARLVHAISGEKVQDWRDVKEVRRATDVDGGDYVIYDDWIGQVIELFDELLVSASGTFVRLPEISSRLTIGDKGPDILPNPETLHGTVIYPLGAPLPSPDDTVIDMKRTILAICWLAVNQSLDPSIAQLKQRPKRFWSGEDMTKLTVIRMRLDDIRVGDKVLLEKDVGIPVKKYGAESGPQGALTIKTLCVTETKTVVNVLWQDGSQESLPSTELIPYLNPDEYDCWPGDHVLWKFEHEEHPAIVQSVNSTDRVAIICLTNTGKTEAVSVLELDPNGASDWAAGTPHTHLGMRRGDKVFVHREGTSNGFESPRVPRIGEIEEWVREVPVRPDGEFSGWRRTMADLGTKIASERKERPSVYRVKHPTKDDASFSWFGEVTGLRLDGTVDVTHPNGSMAIYPLSRLTKLYDSLEQFEDDGWEGEEDGSDHGSHVENTDGVWHLDSGGMWRYDPDDSEWEDEEDDNEDGHEMDVDTWADDIDIPLSNSMPGSLIPRDVTPDVADSASPLPVSPSNTSPDATQEINVQEDEDGNADSPWKKFEVLPSAPHDHAFYSSVSNQPSKNFLARLTKEYRALSTSLPESILVRAYEDRTDLLRCLIIGPENTPYEDAPFVIDWMLDSNFPQSPPIAHFWSWTNGNGRVNPNLYEEGKVCLSILGTWSGDRTETWSAARSSLLQALVSIQGLVLVKEPWFCEPAYEKLRGTEEGTVNSRLYSEKAYVLSRGFVRRALEIPLGGLEAEINWLYNTHGRLAKVLHESRALIQKSQSEPENTEADQNLAVPRLTAGGIIMLERTLTKLQTLLDQM